MPEHEVSYHELTKDYLEEVSPEKFAENQAKLTDGWNLAQTGLPLAVGTAAVLRVDVGSVIAKAPKDVPDPVKGFMVGAGAAALTWVGVRATRWVKEHRDSRVSKTDHDSVVHDDMTHANW